MGTRRGLILLALLGLTGLAIGAPPAPKTKTKATPKVQVKPKTKATPKAQPAPKVQVKPTVTPKAPAPPKPTVAPAKAGDFLKLSRPGPPNILFILIDPLRADHLGTYGYKHNTSPAIDAIAKRGVVFEQARSTGPSTRFSVPPMLVGKYLTEIRRTYAFWPRISKKEVLITEHLKRANYKTGAIHSMSPRRDAISARIVTGTVMRKSIQ